MGTSAESAADAPSGRRHTVGQLLRETRERFGTDINRVAAALRIRVAYLEALEAGRYDDLPGGVYALGFVRAYAVHLGLDGEEAVRRFKAEAEGFDEQQDLIFPVPLAERSIPGGTMVLAVVILALCGSGLLYYLSESARPRPERVSAVPAELLPTSVAPAPAASAPSVAVSSSSPMTASSPSSAEPSTPSDAASIPPAPTATPQPASHANAVPPMVPAMTTPAAPAWDLPTTASHAAPATTPARAPDAPPSPPVPVAAALPNVPDAGAAPVAEAPHAYGIANTRARIIIRAVGDSWVQVRDENSVPIFTRQLHAGDSYRVPDRPGLSLRTGKGTALAITVDGRAVPAIGGGVHSNVLLDTERLLAGTAVVPASRPSPAPPVTSGVAPETTPATTE